MPTESSTPRRRVTVLAGGVGAARYLRALLGSNLVAPSAIGAIVNTGDDTTFNGLRICPDLDTVTYTLAGAIDPERGWGLIDETWNALGALERYRAVVPAASAAATTWFGLGDRDLATHLYRTSRLAEGATLTEVTAEITRAWGVEIALLPMSDQPVSTRVSVIGTGWTDFQDYFVRQRHCVPIDAIDIDTTGARLGPAAAEALADADTVVIAPSNPLVSIGPIRALAGVDDALGRRRESVVAISPIVGGAALKGPADRMLTELGHEPSVVGVARLYREIAGTLIIDEADRHLAAEIQALGMRCTVTPTVMSLPGVGAELARRSLEH